MQQLEASCGEKGISFNVRETEIKDPNLWLICYIITGK